MEIDGYKIAAMLDDNFPFTLREFLNFVPRILYCA